MAHRVYVICAEGESYFDLDAGEQVLADELARRFGESFGYDLDRTEFILTFQDEQDKDRPLNSSQDLRTDDRLHLLGIIKGEPCP